MPTVSRRAHTRKGKPVRSHTVKVRAATTSGQARSARRVPLSMTTVGEVSVGALAGAAVGWAARAVVATSLAAFVGVTFGSVSLIVWFATTDRRRARRHARRMARRRRPSWAARRRRRRRVRWKARRANARQWFTEREVKRWRRK